MHAFVTPKYKIPASCLQQRQVLQWQPDSTRKQPTVKIVFIIGLGIVVQDVKKDAWKILYHTFEVLLL